MDTTPESRAAVLFDLQRAIGSALFDAGEWLQIAKGRETTHLEKTIEHLLAAKWRVDQLANSELR